MSDDADEYSVSDALINQSSVVLLAVLLLLRLGVRVVWSPLRLRDSISITEDSGGSANRTFLCRAAVGPRLCTAAVLVGRLYRRDNRSKSGRYVAVEWYDTVGVMTGLRVRRNNNGDNDDDDDDDDGDADGDADADGGGGGLRDAADNRRSVQPRICTSTIISTH